MRSVNGVVFLAVMMDSQLIARLDRSDRNHQLPTIFECQCKATISQPTGTGQGLFQKQANATRTHRQFGTPWYRDNFVHSPGADLA